MAEVEPQLLLPKPQSATKLKLPSAPKFPPKCSQTENNRDCPTQWVEPTPATGFLPKNHGGGRLGGKDLGSSEGVVLNMTVNSCPGKPWESSVGTWYTGTSWYTAPQAQVVTINSMGLWQLERTESNTRMRHKDKTNESVNVCFKLRYLRYREKDSRMPNWIELPVNPPNARKIQIHNLAAGTTYEFQVCPPSKTSCMTKTKTKTKILGAGTTYGFQVCPHPSPLCSHHHRPHSVLEM